MDEKSNLVGRCFVIFGKNQTWDFQGFVKSDLGGGFYMIRFFDALLGEPSTIAVFHLSDMKCAPKRTLGSWEFFENDEHLREWIEQWGQK